MARFPELPLWTDSWIADTNHLTRCERGTYLDVLVLMWRTPHCQIPNDNAWLGRHLRMTPVEVIAELRPLIAEFCQSDGNFLFQKRLRKEFLLSQQRSHKATAAAKAREYKKKDKHVRYASTSTSTTISDPAYAGLKVVNEHSHNSVPFPLDQPLTSPSPKTAAPPSPRPASVEADLFRRGKEVLGEKSGGLIAKLLKVKNKDVLEVMGILENAADTENPREYVGRVLSGRVRQDDLRTIIGF